MRTSPSQFEVIVDFMERNGDLNKPADGPHGRLSNIIKWEELSGVLNIDASGTPKTVEKWKKVWSDLKNNTKRKAGKINRAASGTGGGPASKLVLTDLEQRVLNIMGPQAVTGLPGISEVGLELPEPLAAIHSFEQLPSPAPIPTQDAELVHEEENMNVPGRSSLSTPVQLIPAEMVVMTPTRHHVQSPPSQGPRRSYSSPQPAAPRRRVLRRSRRPRVDAVSEQFLNMDTHWRNLATEFVTQNARQRERELELQSQW